MTLDEVARKAGVSSSTVSRVLNGKHGPSIATIRKVMAAAEKIKYVPAPPGKRPGMRRAGYQEIRHGLIGLVILDDGFRSHCDLFAKLVAGVVRSAEVHGLEVLISIPLSRSKLPGRIEQGHVDGLLLAGHQADPRIVNALPPVPRVWMTSRRQEGEDQVLMGNESAGVLAAKYLMKQTSGPIASINPLSLHPALRRRCDAFEFTLAEAGRSCQRLDGAAVSPAAGDVWSREQGLNLLDPLLRQLMGQATVPAGLFVPDDLWMAAVHPRLKAAGKLPEQLVSCGGQTSYLFGLEPAPAIVDIAQEVLGQQAVEQLVRKIQGDSNSSAVLLAITPELVMPR